MKKIKYTSPEYWNRLLNDDGLSMEAGTSRRLTYVGDAQTLEGIAGDEEMGTNDSSRAKAVTYEEN